MRALRFLAFTSALLVVMKAERSPPWRCGNRPKGWWSARSDATPARKWYFQALREITGQDFGESVAEWASWWTSGK